MCVIKNKKLNNTFKRFLDIVTSLVLLILLMPVFIIIAILIKVNDGGPILFWSKRYGKNKIFLFHLIY